MGEGIRSRSRQFYRPLPNNYDERKASMRVVKKSTRIKNEKNRLIGILEDAGVDVAESHLLELVERMAWQVVQMQDMERDIDENGTTEPFRQSEKVDAYDRERPIVRQYNQFAKLHQTATKQLTDVIAKTNKGGGENDLEAIASFISSR